MENKKHVPNHQPVYIYSSETGISSPLEAHECRRGFCRIPQGWKTSEKKSHIFGQVLFWTSNMKLLSKYHPLSVVSKINIQRKCYQNQHHPISVVFQRFQSFKSSSFSCWAISVSATFFILAKRSLPKLFKQRCILYSI